MRQQLAKAGSWLLGLGALVLIVWWFRPADFVDTFRSLGIAGILAWSVLTIVARFSHGETTVIPLNALGLPISRADVFWIGWLRTFASQLVPLAGIAAYAHALRTRTNISWSALAALATPQFVLAATALGLFGIAALLSRGGFADPAVVILLAVYVGLTIASYAIAHGAPWVLGLLPGSLKERGRETADTLARLRDTRGLVPWLVVFHLLVIVLRGARLWLIFYCVGIELGISDTLVLVAIAESTMLIQVTPGSLGLREGAIIGGAALAGIDAATATAVALVDRSLVVAITALLTPPSVMILKRRPTSD